MTIKTKRHMRFIDQVSTFCVVMALLCGTMAGQTVKSKLDIAFDPSVRGARLVTGVGEHEFILMKGRKIKYLIFSLEDSLKLALFLNGQKRLESNPKCQPAQFMLGYSSDISVSLDPRGELIEAKSIAQGLFYLATRNSQKIATLSESLPAIAIIDPEQNHMRDEVFSKTVRLYLLREIKDVPYTSDSLIGEEYSLREFMASASPTPSAYAGGKETNDTIATQESKEKATPIETGPAVGLSEAKSEGKLVVPSTPSKFNASKSGPIKSLFLTGTISMTVDNHSLERKIPLAELKEYVVPKTLDKSAFTLRRDGVKENGNYECTEAEWARLRGPNALLTKGVSWDVKYECDGNRLNITVLNPKMASFVWQPQRIELEGRKTKSKDGGRKALEADLSSNLTLTAEDGWAKIIKDTSDGLKFRVTALPWLTYSVQINKGSRYFQPKTLECVWYAADGGSAKVLSFEQKFRSYKLEMKCSDANQRLPKIVFDQNIEAIRMSLGLSIGGERKQIPPLAGDGKFSLPEYYWAAPTNTLGWECTNSLFEIGSWKMVGDKMVLYFQPKMKQYHLVVHGKTERELSQLLIKDPTTKSWTISYNGKPILESHDGLNLDKPVPLFAGLEYGFAVVNPLYEPDLKKFVPADQQEIKILFHSRRLGVEIDFLPEGAFKDWGVCPQKYILKSNRATTVGSTNTHREVYYADGFVPPLSVWLDSLDAREWEIIGDTQVREGITTKQIAIKRRTIDCQIKYFFEATRGIGMVSGFFEGEGIVTGAGQFSFELGSGKEGFINARWPIGGYPLTLVIQKPAKFNVEGDSNWSSSEYRSSFHWRPNERIEKRLKPMSPLHIYFLDLTQGYQDPARIMDHISRQVSDLEQKKDDVNRSYIFVSNGEDRRYGSNKDKDRILQGIGRFETASPNPLREIEFMWNQSMSDISSRDRFSYWIHVYLSRSSYENLFRIGRDGKDTRDALDRFERMGIKANEMTFHIRREWMEEFKTIGNKILGKYEIIAN